MTCSHRNSLQRAIKPERPTLRGASWTHLQHSTNLFNHAHISSTSTERSSNYLPSNRGTPRFLPSPALMHWWRTSTRGSHDRIHDAHKTTPNEHAFQERISIPRCCYFTLETCELPGYLLASMFLFCLWPPSSFVRRPFGMCLRMYFFESGVQFVRRYYRRTRQYSLVESLSDGPLN